MSKNIRPLSNEELLTVAPSIFSENPIDGVSDKYAFVATHKLLDTFRDSGYYPIMASESKARENNQGYQKHIIQIFELISHRYYYSIFWHIMMLLLELHLN